MVPVVTRRKIARVLTEVFTPVVLVVGLLEVIGVAGTPHRLAGLGWGALGALFAGVVPYGIVLLGVRRGTIGDHHIVDRAQRMRPRWPVSSRSSPGSPPWCGWVLPGGA